MSDFLSKDSEVLKPQQEEEKPKIQRDPDVEIKLARLELYQKRYFIVYEVEKPSNVYLVDKNQIQKTTSVQKVPRSVLKSSDKPYNWDEELNQFTYTVDEMRLALYRAGMVEAPDQPVSFKAILASLLRSGLLPIKE